MAMEKSVLEATPRVLKILDETIKRTHEKGTIVVIGVGNTSGVGNNKKATKRNEEEIRKVIKKMANRKKKKKKRFKFF